MVSLSISRDQIQEFFNISLHVSIISREQLLDQLPSLKIMLIMFLLHVYDCETLHRVVNFFKILLGQAMIITRHNLEWMFIQVHPDLFFKILFGEPVLGIFICQLNTQIARVWPMLELFLEFVFLLFFLLQLFGSFLLGFLRSPLSLLLFLFFLFFAGDFFGFLFLSHGVVNV